MCGGIALIDCDGDGKVDIFLTNGSRLPEYDRPDPSFYGCLLRNRGEGEFEDVTERSGFGAVKGKGMGIALADYDGNGWMDVFIANDTEPNFLYMNQGDGTFREDSWAWGVAYDDQGAVVSGMGADCADYDNDGWKDIYSANGDVDYLGSNSEQHDTMFHNVEGQGFVDVSEGLGEDFLPLGYQRGSATGDLNDDGFPDLVVTALNRKPRILLNSGGNGNHWLWLDLVGRRSNRDAIGAKVKVTTGTGRSFYNHVSVSSGFMSSKDRRLHFGLGGNTSIRSVEIEWPSGRTQVLEHVKVDRRVRIEEPG